MKQTLKIAVIAGEESGDILGADLVASLKDRVELEIIGVGGAHLAAQGLVSQFDPSEIALMGIGPIIKKLPRLIGLINKTAAFIASQKPDCLIVIDSPGFCHRVARKVRRADPSILIINYVCPSVWAWRPGRAKAMKPYIDHILSILPFEPKILAELDGPQTTYVGHRAASDEALLGAMKSQQNREQHRSISQEKQLLILPGSRRSELRRSMIHMAETVRILHQRGNIFRVLLPTLPRLENEVRQLTKSWVIAPHIVTDAQSKYEMFAAADAALATSGTVTLELALCRVPMISIYDFDVLARLIIRKLFTGWTASLPNLIADSPIVPEHYNEQIRPGLLARNLERLMNPSQARDAQLAGFSLIRENMKTEIEPNEKAAETAIALIQARKLAANQTRS